MLSGFWYCGQPDGGIRNRICEAVDLLLGDDEYLPRIKFVFPFLNEAIALP